MSDSLTLDDGVQVSDPASFLEIGVEDIIEVLREVIEIDIIGAVRPDDVQINTGAVAEALFDMFNEANRAALVGLAVVGSELVHVCRAADVMTVGVDNFDTQRYIKTRNLAMDRVLEVLPRD